MRSSANQANVHSQLRLAKSMSHIPTEADLQHPPKRPKTNVNSSRPLCITRGRPPPPLTPLCSDPTTVSHSRPPDQRQSTPTTTFNHGLSCPDTTNHRPLPTPTDRPPDPSITNANYGLPTAIHPLSTDAYGASRSDTKGPDSHATSSSTSPSTSAPCQSSPAERRLS